jgi:SNF2 family DNA or RNA helicase
MAISGRFEWVTIPKKDDRPQKYDTVANAFEARACPGCGWLDGARRFEDLSGETGTRECWRCGMRWDLSVELNSFFEKEQIKLPPVEVTVASADPKKFYRSISKESGLFDLFIQAQHLTLQNGFGDLLSLHTLQNIARLDHQIKTVKRVLKQMRGRALLADEVGLGKTIEAGILIKELVIRGIVKSVLIMVPAGLCYQWQSELETKFDENFRIFSGCRLKSEDLQVIVSYDLAKRRQALLERQWDMLVLDEAHCLKNRSTKIYKFVKDLKSRYLLALSATPVQNSLDELYSLINIVKPGRLGTIRTFKNAFVSKTNPRNIPEGREPALKEILSGVMIRNRRDICALHFPCRRVGIYYVKPSAPEKGLYKAVSAYVKQEYKQEFLRETGTSAHMLSLIILQRELMSTPPAVQKTLLRIAERSGYPQATRKRLCGFADMAAAIKSPSKVQALKKILTQFKDHRFVVFTEFVSSLNCLANFITEWSRPVFCLSGRQNVRHRTQILDTFAHTDKAVLISTETGGVGLNLQFCNHMVNFDLPWNPQRIEQRIGRIDRIGQRHSDIYVFNLVCQGTVEEHVVDILTRKLRMFELVVGEMNEVLGHMQKGKSFENLVARIWLKNKTEKQINFAFTELGKSVAEARARYDLIRSANSQLH